MTEGAEPAFRVVVDARPALDPRRTGVGRYTEQLLRHLPSADPGTSYVAWYLHSRGLFRSQRFFADGAPSLSEKASRMPARLFRPVSSRTGFPRVEWSTGSFDLLVATNFLPPATERLERTVLVVHDLAHEVMPQTAPHHNARWRVLFERALQGCAAVIVPSGSARNDLLTRHNVPEERVHVVPHGVDPAEFAPLDPEAVHAIRARLGIPDGNYVLFIGGIEPRKNLEGLVGAFGSIGDGATDVSLVIAGGAVPWFPKADGSVDAAISALPPGVRSRVIRTGYVDDPDRGALLSGAVALAYPSLYEGFGFPVLEAFAAGVPVLTSNVSSLPEVAGDAALLVDPHDEQAIARGLSTLLRDPAMRERLTAAGRARVAAFSWDTCAKRTAEVLHQARPRGHG